MIKSTMNFTMQGILWSTNTLQNLSNQRYCRYSSLHSNCRAFSLTWQAAIFFFLLKQKTKLVAQHRWPSMRSPIPIVPMHSFFVWSSSSVVNGLQVYVQRQRRRRTIWRPYLSTYALHTSMQFDIWGPFYGQATGVKSRYLLTSSTWPYRRVRLELIEVKCFF